MILDLIAIIIILLGVLGTILPGVPGTPAIFLMALIYAWLKEFAVLTGRQVILLLALMLIAQGVEYLASFLSAKYYGASKLGLIGAFIGTALGILFLGPLGFLIGPFIGAVVFELFTDKSFKTAVKVGFGTVVGSLGGSLFSFLVAIAMASIFIFNILAG